MRLVLDVSARVNKTKKLRQALKGATVVTRNANGLRIEKPVLWGKGLPYEKDGGALHTFKGKIDTRCSRPPVAV